MELGDYTSCNPQCHNDADCDGRRCDLASGACVDSIVGSLPPGSACDPEADECRNGLCWELPTAPGAPGASCLGTCTLGTIGCGHDPASAAPLSFACLFAWAAGSVAGDLGLCAELCDCADACTHPNFTCTPLPEGARSKFGRDGYCRPALNPDGAAVPHLTCGD
jgi:hypothetical protein